jgi:hypothetical protein
MHLTPSVAPQADSNDTSAITPLSNDTPFSSVLAEGTPYIIYSSFHFIHHFISFIILSTHP